MPATCRSLMWPRLRKHKTANRSTASPTKDDKKPMHPLANDSDTEWNESQERLVEVAFQVPYPKRLDDVLDDIHPQSHIIISLAKCYHLCPPTFANKEANHAFSDRVHAYMGPTTWKMKYSQTLDGYVLTITEILSR